MGVENNFRSSPRERQAAAYDFSALVLPPIRLRARTIPGREETREMAHAIRAQFSVDAGRIAIAEAIIDANGWGISYRAFHQPDHTSRSTLQSLLVPLLTGGFSVVVNSQHNPNNDRAAALISHEIGHTFFYDQASIPPRRFNQESPLPGEEDFCDEFAFALTDVTLS